MDDDIDLMYDLCNLSFADRLLVFEDLKKERSTNGKVEEPAHEVNTRAPNKSLIDARSQVFVEYEDTPQHQLGEVRNPWDGEYLNEQLHTIGLRYYSNDVLEAYIHENQAKAARPIENNIPEQKKTRIEMLRNMAKKIKSTEVTKHH